MASFFEFLASNELTLVVCLMIIVFILVISIIVMDIVSKKKNNDEEEINDLVLDNVNANNDGIGMVADTTALDKIDVEAVTKSLERTQEIEEIKYVEEDEEIEKTKALLELETLKKELAKMEQEKELEPVTPVTTDTNEKIENEVVNDAVIDVKVEEVDPIINEPNEVSAPIVDENEIIENQINLNENNIPSMEEEVETFESSQEEHAIISVEELMEASKNITEEEIEEYEDDGNEPISIKELEALYKSVEEPVKLEVEIEKEKQSFPELDIKVKPASEVYEGREFKNSDVISPVFGLKATEESITLEHTANLDKLNEEIRKTNEFLSALKELRKNLD